MTERKNQFNDGLPEILPPVYDIVFKQVFATRPDLLKPLLKSAINLPEEDFGEITVSDPHVYPEHTGGKLGILDIKVTLKSKTVIDVEMQKEKLAHLRERVLFYCSGMIREQTAPGDKGYEKLKPVVSVTITNYPAIPDDGAYHPRYTLYDPKTRSEFTDLLTVHLIELPKLPKEDDGSDLWWWMRFLTVKTREELAMIAEKNPVLEKAAERLVEVSEDAATRRRLERELILEMDQRDRINAGREEGLQKGREEGIEEGIERGILQGKRETALAMKKKGFDHETIAQITGLSVDEIIKIKFK
jgi:predicted transposase/invertase (TIGR01784 family)